MKQLCLVGIDVGAKELAVKVERNGRGSERVPIFPNSPSGHKKLAKYITQQGGHVKVCMEATGVYHFTLALFLHRQKNIEVMVAHPKSIRYFSKALMQCSKTDPLDAEVILEYLKRMEFAAWQPPSNLCLEIQAISRRIFQLKSEKVREKSRSHCSEYNSAMAGIISNDIDVNVRHLERRMSHLEAKAVELIETDEQLKMEYDLLRSITGIAVTSAIKILSEIWCMPQGMQSAQWVAHAGLAPRAIESGSSICKPRRISKSGNRYLRTALYMPALVATQKDTHVKGYYEKLIAKGKKPLQAIIAVMRKLLLAIWGMLKSDTEWRGDKISSIN